PTEDLTLVVLQPGSDAARILAAGLATAYLVRPDSHIAARWTRATAKQVRTALKLSKGEAA
ncbi:MAG: hypothetical protein P1U53_07450, partial [Sulfitobacter sp.]|nr:hypothetical protein [Sulfitobacter sp.]